MREVDAMVWLKEFDSKIASEPPEVPENCEIDLFTDDQYIFYPLKPLNRGKRIVVSNWENGSGVVSKVYEDDNGREYKPW